MNVCECELTGEWICNWKAVQL